MVTFRSAILLPLIVVLAVGACSQFRASDGRIAEDLAEEDIVPEFRSLESGGRTLRYMVVGDNDLPRVLFIHGAPGSLDAFNDYFAVDELRGRAQLVSVDRPGYGYSDFGRTEPDLAVQADLIGELLTQDTVIVGHSIGGTIAMRIAMDRPDLVAALVLVAPGLAPGHEKPFWFNRPMERKALNWLMPTAWKVANTERLRQKENLEAMRPLWPRVSAPVHIVHGTRDRLIAIDHSYAAVEWLPPETTVLDIIEGEGHFILWSEIDRITEAILSYIP